MSVIELLKKTKTILQHRERKWKQGNTVMLDVYGGRERHVYMEPQSTDDKPHLRQFGP